MASVDTPQEHRMRQMPESMSNISSTSVVLTCILLIIVTPLGGITPVEAQHTDLIDEVAAFGSETHKISPEEALEQRERAQQLLAELQQIDEEPMISVEQSTLRSISSRVQNGNLSYNRAKYRKAVNHWQVAQEQARAALQSHYASGAERSLNATTHYLNKRSSAGYQSAQLSEYQQRVAALQAQNPESLADHRHRYNTARQLHDDVETSVPSSTVVSLANFLSPIWVRAILAGLGLGMIVVSGLAGYQLGKDEDEEIVTGPGPDVRDDGPLR